ncbi:MAG: PorV/PorQ family protein [Ignavibacteriales bacterium]|nr:PorV/PorQ family protein [Ignavibacteriales bacterium]
MKINTTNFISRRFLPALLLSIIAQFIFMSSLYSQVKLAQTGFGFLSVSTDARATAMGEAVTTVGGTATSLFFNPAGISEMTSLVQAGVSQMKWIADIKYFSGSLAFAPFKGEYGVLGLDFTRVNYGEFKFTSVASNEQGFVDLAGYPEPYAYAIKLVYGKRLSEEFAVGGRVKYAYQNLGSSQVPVYNQVIIDSVLTTDTTYEVKKYSLNVLAFDFGTIYRTGFKSLAFGMSISNFSREIAYERESFQLPLTFRFGISMNLMDFIPTMSEYNSFILSIDAVHPRSYSEYLNIGGEYVFMNTLALRAGYVTKQDDYGLTLGFGVHKFGFAFDYSYISHKVLNNVQRFSFSFAL